MCNVKNASHFESRDGLGNTCTMSRNASTAVLFILTDMVLKRQIIRMITY